MKHTLLGLEFGGWAIVFGQQSVGIAGLSRASCYWLDLKAIAIAIAGLCSSGHPKKYWLIAKRPEAAFGSRSTADTNPPLPEHFADHGRGAVKSFVVWRPQGSPWGSF